MFSEILNFQADIFYGKSAGGLGRDGIIKSWNLRMMPGDCTANE